MVKNCRHQITSGSSNNVFSPLSSLNMPLVLKRTRFIQMVVDKNSTKLINDFKFSYNYFRFTEIIYIRDLVLVTLNKC